ncbi:MAG: lipase [Solirubrobacterales bacterium]|nr:lipase [Solirubrobacterales bacterium]
MRSLPSCLLVAAVVVSIGAPAAQAQVPEPDNDPFYAVPVGIGALADGSILDSRQIQPVALGIPLRARAWQVKFKTVDNQARATATVTTVLVPFAAWQGPGPRPLLSYQAAEDGVGTRCAPSYGLRAGLVTANSNAGNETLLIALALQEGWTVAAPDYEGPRSQFLGVTAGSHGVLDGIRAARAFKPAGISASAPVGLWGYSGGALATSWAAQLQAEQAPELRFAGVALGGVTADLKATFKAFNGGPAGGAVAVALVGLDRSYPEADIPQYLNAAGRRLLVDGSKDCLADAVVRHPLLDIADYESKPNIIEDPAFSALLTRSSSLGVPGTPTAPVYAYTAEADEFAPIGPARRLVARYCAAGVPVQQVVDPVGEHVTELALGAQGAIGYLRDRFAGKPIPDTCPPGSRAEAAATHAVAARYVLSVSPAHPRAGTRTRTRFTFTARRRQGGRLRVVSGAIVHFAHRAARTTSTGHATIFATLPRAHRRERARLVVHGQTVAERFVPVR